MNLNMIMHLVVNRLNLFLKLEVVVKLVELKKSYTVVNFFLQLFSLKIEKVVTKRHLTANNLSENKMRYYNLFLKRNSCLKYHQPIISHNLFSPP